MYIVRASCDPTLASYFYSRWSGREAHIA